jgi:FkbM family methyltransferase
LLDWYQKLHPRYDRWLPVLAAHLPQDSLVIDVGANVGDSAVPFLRRNIRTVCVEPSRFFQKYLCKNIADSGFAHNAVVVEALVGCESGIKQLRIERGTAVVSDRHKPKRRVEAISQCVSLDEIIDQAGGVTLLKTDTDGFDHDVLASGLRGIRSHHPIIYFENAVCLENVTGYHKVYDALERLGYNDVVVFDNLGNLMLDGATWGTLKQLNRYMMEPGVPGIPYLDVLIYCNEHRAVIGEALRAYSR